MQAAGPRSIHCPATFSKKRKQMSELLGKDLLIEMCGELTLDGPVFLYPPGAN